MSHGQTEAAYALGLRRGPTLRLVVIPQASRVIIPPLTNQYLNLTKNSSLAAAIAYPDLVLVFAGTALMQTGQAVEIIAITMAVYLTISLDHRRGDEHLQPAHGTGGALSAVSATPETFDPGRHPDLAPPAIEVGVIGWLRHNLFSSPLNAAPHGARARPPLCAGAADRAMGADRCRLGRRDARGLLAPWARAGCSSRCGSGKLMVGLYTPDERWRVALAFAILIVAAIPALHPALQGTRRGSAPSCCSATR